MLRSPIAPNPRIEILGCPIDDVTRSEAIDTIRRMIASGGPHRISVVNANKLFLMRRDPELDQIVRSSEMIVGEWAILWAAQILGLPMRDYVGGVILLRDILPVAEKEGWRVFFLGAEPHVISALRAKLLDSYPELQVAGARDGYFSQASSRAVIQEIANSRVDLLFVALGSPKQERWIAQNRDALNVPVAMGVGGSFDIVAGLRKDAPPWAHAHGLEWAYRIAQDPRKWKRYAVVNPWFVWCVGLDWLRRSRKRTQW